VVGWASGEGVYKGILGVEGVREVQGRDRNTSFGKDGLWLVLFVFGKRGFELSRLRMSGSSPNRIGRVRMVPCEKA
jgi:hypothetical protein